MWRLLLIAWFLTGLPATAANKLPGQRALKTMTDTIRGGKKLSATQQQHIAGVVDRVLDAPDAYHLLQSPTKLSAKTIQAVEFLKAWFGSSAGCKHRGTLLKLAPLDTPSSAPDHIKWNSPIRDVHRHIVLNVLPKNAASCDLVLETFANHSGVQADFVLGLLDKFGEKLASGPATVRVLIDRGKHSEVKGLLKGPWKDHPQRKALEAQNEQSQPDDKKIIYRCGSRTVCKSKGGCGTQCYAGDPEWYRH